MYELVQRGTTTYLRLAPDRSFEKGSKYRKQAILNFSRASHAGYGKKYEELIKFIKEHIKPVGREVKVRTITMTPSELRRLRGSMIKRGIKELRLPNIRIRIVKEHVPVRVKA